MSDVKPKKPRKTKAAPEATSDLVLPMRWAMLAQKDGVGLANYQTHCRIAGGWVVAFDGAVAAGHRINVDWFACPHSARFLAALERSTEGVSLVVGESAITVKSGRLTVRVPCLDTMAPVDPPALQAIGCGQELIDAIRKVLPACKESGTTVLESSIELSGGMATATDRRLMLQAWHGVDLPRMILPRAAASILLKQDGLTGVDLGNGAVIFWFGPDKWLRFNLYDPAAYPDVARIFNVEDNAQPLPEGFKEGVAALLPHVGENGLIQIGDYMSTGEDAARFNVRVGDAPIWLRAECLKHMSLVATRADFNAGGKVIFYGDKMRGALAHAVP